MCSIVSCPNRFVNENPLSKDKRLLRKEKNGRDADFGLVDKYNLRCYYLYII